jgi:hypothetical protein
MAVMTTRYGSDWAQVPRKKHVNSLALLPLVLFR